MSDFTHLAVSISLKKAAVNTAAFLLFSFICVTFCMIYYAYLYRSQ